MSGVTRGSLVLAAAALALGSGSARASENSFWYGDQLPGPVASGVHGFMTTRSPLYGGYSPLEVLQGALVRFDNWPGELPGLKIFDATKTWETDGYTLLSSLGGHLDANGQLNFAILIDMEGNIVKEWPYAAFPAKMLPGGHLVASDGDVPQHQEYARLLQVDWCGNEVWSWDGFGGDNARAHHDWQREGNPVGYYAPKLRPKTHGGKTLVLSHFTPDASLTQHVTDVVETDGTKRVLEDDAIHEVDWQGNVVWSWYAYQHYHQMGFDPVAREAIRTIMIQAPANIGGGFQAHDWQHINSASYLGPNPWYDRGDLRFHPDNVIWDGRSSNLIAIVARHDHPRGKWKSGDIVWKTGPHYYEGLPEYQVGQIIGQHMAHMIPEGLPGQGNILVFDNGGLAGFGALMPGAPAFWPTTYRNFSRVVEYNPVTMKVEWEYRNLEQKPGARKFFSWFISGAQRLPNGNTFITEGSTGRMIEVTPDGTVVWEYISPFADRQGTGFGNAVYRAYRVPAKWVPENRTCPQLHPVAGEG